MVPIFDVKRVVPGVHNDAETVAFEHQVQLTECGALEKAQVTAAWMPGAAALRVMADDETGELEGVTILGQFGEVPRISPRACGAGDGWPHRIEEAPWR